MLKTREVLSPKPKRAKGYEGLISLAAFTMTFPTSSNNGANADSDLSFASLEPNVGLILSMGVTNSAI